jgi:hypothetical protein
MSVFNDNNNNHYLANYKKYRLYNFIKLTWFIKKRNDMKKNILIYLLVFVGLYTSCTDDEINKAHFTISAIEKSTNTYLSGGTYSVSKEGNVVATYTLSNGKIEVSDLPFGSYTIAEVTPPDGYVFVGEKKQMVYIYYQNNSEDFIFFYANSTTRTLPETEELGFYSSQYNNLMGNYTAVRVGEYYWINQNFTHTVPDGATFENDYPVTQQTLDKYMERIRIDKSFFQLQNISDFEKYYGRHYSYPSILYMNKYGYMVNSYGEKVNGWSMPTPNDYRQLFAMSPFNTSNDQPHTALNERDVRFALGAKEGDNLLAYDLNHNDIVDKTYWYDSKYTTNMYKFNLMPNGARLNGDGTWCNGFGCYPDSKKGDIYHLFYAAYLATGYSDNPLYIGAIELHDYVDTEAALNYHFLGVRWCRKLTDNELGYKLYINTDMTDIKKLDLETATPEGYKELPHGYLRGFYVQYMLNNPNSGVTVKDLVNYSRSVEDNYVSSRKSDSSIIF